MGQKLLAWGVAVMVATTVAACGDDGSQTALASRGFLRGPLPAEQTLCRLEMGSSTVAEARSVLGEPTDTSSFTNQTTLGYYWGSAVDLRASLLLSFDEQGKMSSAFLQDIAFPQCWRDQQAEIEAREAAEDG